MALNKMITTITTHAFFPFRMTGTAMRPNILLLCKLLFLMICLYGFMGYMNDPHIPFLRIFDRLRDFPGAFKLLTRSLFLVAGLLLLFNIRVRAMAIVLGLTIIVVILASKPVFRNHLFICGCFFFLAGLTNKNQDPWLLYLQLSIVYIGAVINKLLQLDWWNGEFMHYWLATARENLFYISVAKALPEMAFAKFLSWSSMLIEFTIALLILNKKTHKIAVWLILIFHSLLYTMTMHRFGHFYEDIVIGLLMFINWPKEALLIQIDERRFPLLKKGISAVDFNRNIIWSHDPMEQTNWFEIQTAGKKESNWNGLRRFLIYSTNFYIVLFGLDFFVRFLFNGFTMDVIHLTTTWIVVLFFLPMLWNRTASKNIKAIA